MHSPELHRIKGDSFVGELADHVHESTCEALVVAGVAFEVSDLVDRDIVARLDPVVADIARFAEC